MRDDNPALDKSTILERNPNCDCRECNTLARLRVYYGYYYEIT